MTSKTDQATELNENDILINSFVQRIQEINVFYLTIASEAARTIPLESSWLFGMDSEYRITMASLTLSEIEELSKCGRVLFSLPIQLDRDYSQITLAETTILCDRGD